MNHSVLDIPPYLNEEEVDLVARPLMTTGQRGHGEALDTGEKILAIPYADFLPLVVPRPRVNRPLGPGHLDVDEPSLHHDLFE